MIRQPFMFTFGFIPRMGVSLDEATTRIRQAINDLEIAAGPIVKGVPGSAGYPIRVRGASVKPAPVQEPAARPKAAPRPTPGDVRQAIWSARRAVRAAHGPQWAVHLRAPYACIPGRIANYTVTDADGSTHRMRHPRNFPIPPAEYWPGGVIPEGVELPAPDTQDTILRRQKQRDHAAALADWHVSGCPVGGGAGA